jgi:hypothetical protein
MSSFFSGLFFGGGFFSQPVPPAVEPPKGGGDSTRFRRPKGPRKWRYWWEKEDPIELLQEDPHVIVLEKEEVLQEPEVVQALWEERMALQGYMIEVAAQQASRQVLDKLSEIDVFLQEREKAARARILRRKKALALLLH